MSQQDALMRDDDIDVIGIFAQLKKRWLLIIAIPLVVGALLLVGLSIATPKYVSTARILITERSGPFTSTTEDSTRIVDTRPDEEAVRSQVEVIKSNKLALSVINKLALMDYAEFTKESLLDRLANYINPREPIAPVTENDVENGNLTPLQNRALEVFNKKLDVYPIDQSRVIVIEFTSISPSRAQAITAEIARAYTNFKAQLQQSNSESAAIWLDPRIAELENELKLAEAEVAKYRANSDILLSDNNNALLATQQLSEVSTELSRLKAERSSAQARAASVRTALQNGSSIDVIPEVIDSPLIQRLREREVALRAQISDLSTTLLPNHPRLRSLNSQVEDFRRQIRTAANNILSSLENNVDATREAEADLVKEINRLKAEAARVAEAQVGLRPLEQDAETKRRLLENYRSRLLEAKSREGLDAVEAEVIAAASLPSEPAFPKILPYTAAGIVASLLLTIVSIIALALLSAAARSDDILVSDDSAKEPQPLPAKDVEPLQVAKVIDQDNKTVADKKKKKDKTGNTPKYEEHVLFDEDDEYDDLEADELPYVNAPKLDMSKSDIPIAEEPIEFDDSVLAVRYAASVIADLPQARVLVTSPGGDAGSCTAWMLARSISRSGKSSLIIDLSGGGVTSLEMLGSRDLQGLYALISGATTFDNIVYQDRKSNTHVVPAGILLPYMQQPSVKAMADIIEAIGKSYDFVVIDCGDADIGVLKSIVAEDAIFVISGIGAKPAACNKIEKDLNEENFYDILQIIPDSIDHEKDSFQFAS